MTRRTRTSREAENRLAALESVVSTGETPTLTEAEQKAILDTLDGLGHTVDPDATEREQVGALIHASRERLDNLTDREVALAAVAARETTRLTPTTRRRP